MLNVRKNGKMLKASHDVATLREKGRRSEKIYIKKYQSIDDGVTTVADPNDRVQ